MQHGGAFSLLETFSLEITTYGRKEFPNVLFAKSHEAYKAKLSMVVCFLCSICSPNSASGLNDTLIMQLLSFERLIKWVTTNDYFHSQWLSKDSPSLVLCISTHKSTFSPF